MLKYLLFEYAGGFIMDQERRRIEELRRRAADEGKAMWEERRLREANCKSFNSLESEDSSIASSCDTPSEKDTRSVRFSLCFLMCIAKVCLLKKL